LKDGTLWQPLAARHSATAQPGGNNASSVAKVYPIKFLKGRARQIASRSRAQAREETV
jgi:hypothetical protein